MKIGKGGQMVRSAGAAAQLMAKEGNYALLRMPSGEIRKIHINCRATIGQIGNLEHENLTIGKAGRNRWLGVRPENRGVAMTLMTIHMVVGKAVAQLDANILLLNGVNVLWVLKLAVKKHLINSSLNVVQNVVNNKFMNKVA